MIHHGYQKFLASISEIENVPPQVSFLRIILQANSHSFLMYGVKRSKFDRLTRQTRKTNGISKTTLQKKNSRFCMTC